MPGSYQRDPLPSEAWTREQWTAFRQAQIECRDRSPGAWWETVGRANVTMADAHLARLRVSA